MKSRPAASWLASARRLPAKDGLSIVRNLLARDEDAGEHPRPAALVVGHRVEVRDRRRWRAGTVHGPRTGERVMVRQFIASG